MHVHGISETQSLYHDQFVTQQNRETREIKMVYVVLVAITGTSILVLYL